MAKLKPDPLGVLTQVLPREENKSVVGTTQTSQSARSSTSHPGASDRTVDIITNVPTAIQAVTPIPNAPGKAKRKLTSKDPEYEHRGKRPRYMRFIFGKNDIARTPSATYTEFTAHSPHTCQ